MMMRRALVVAVTVAVFVALANVVALVAAWSPWLSVGVLSIGAWALIYSASKGLAT
jgi:hypothetical protein